VGTVYITASEKVHDRRAMLEIYLSLVPILFDAMTGQELPNNSQESTIVPLDSSLPAATAGTATDRDLFLNV
jgi:hypothetical protein